MRFFPYPRLLFGTVCCTLTTNIIHIPLDVFLFTVCVSIKIPKPKQSLKSFGSSLLKPNCAEIHVKSVFPASSSLMRSPCTRLNDEVFPHRLTLPPLRVNCSSQHIAVSKAADIKHVLIKDDRPDLLVLPLAGFVFSPLF